VGIDALDDDDSRYKECGGFVGLADVEPSAWVYSMGRR
jgi:hypothetical protein